MASIRILRLLRAVRVLRTVRFFPVLRLPGGQPVHQGGDHRDAGCQNTRAGKEQDAGNMQAKMAVASKLKVR